MVLERNLPYTGSFTGEWPISFFPECLQKYEVKCNFLNYIQAVSAIPKHLLTNLVPRTSSLACGWGGKSPFPAPPPSQGKGPESDLAFLLKTREKNVYKCTFLAEKCLLALSEYCHRLAQNESRDYHWLLINKGDVDIKACSK